MVNVFVYGTLMKGYWNHRLLQQSEFLGKGLLNGYDMYRVSSFPGIIPNNKGYITGELYQVDYKTLERLDLLESEGTMYIRKEEDIILGKEKVKAYVYVWNRIIKPGVEKVNEMPWAPIGGRRIENK